MLSDALIGHFCADYLLQNDYLAKGKKESSFICCIHCLIYTLNIVFFAQIGWVAALVVFATHFLQDRGRLISLYMDLVGQADFRKHLGPWSTIAVDNSFHLLVLWLVIRFPQRMGYDTLEAWLGLVAS